MRGPVTEAGYRRQERKIVDCRRALDNAVAELTNDRGGENSAGESRLADMSILHNQKHAAQKVWEDAKRQLGQIRIAPIPSQCNKVQVGHRIKIKYVDATSRHERGEEESFILGGVGESDTDSILRTYSCVSPLGKAMVSAEVGYMQRVETPDGEEYMVKVLEISIPDWKTILSELVA